MAIVLLSPPYFDNTLDTLFSYENFNENIIKFKNQMQGNDKESLEKIQETETEMESVTVTETLKSRLRKRAERNNLNNLGWAEKRQCRETSSSESTNESDSDNSSSNSRSESDHQENQTTSESNVISPQTSQVVVPVDPQVWTSEHIASWVKWITKEFNIDPEPDIQRFPKTGVELCEMSRSDFWVCAGSRTGGCLLAKHFALTLHSATGRETSPMLNDNDPSECRRPLKFNASYQWSYKSSITHKSRFVLTGVNQYKRLVCDSFIFVFLPKPLNVNYSAI